jgi:hypothetical protein
MIECEFVESKHGHGLCRYRYVDKAKYAVQAFFTMMMFNLKRIEKNLNGVVFKILVEVSIQLEWRPIKLKTS